MTKSASQTPSACPCGSGQRYESCCAPLHAGSPASDAAALMRSRYSAYVLQLGDYLLASWHPTTRPAQLELHDGGPALRWLGLQIKRHRVIDNDHAEVEFVARSKHAGRAQRLHETSRFVRLAGRWFYLDGEIHA